MQILCFKRVLLTLIVLFSCVGIFAEKPQAFENGDYKISMLITEDGKQTDLRPMPIDITISVRPNSVKVIRSESLYTPEFDDGESLDLSLKTVETESVSVSYVINEYIIDNNSEGQSLTYCVCRNEDGEECRIVRGVIGSVGNGKPLMAFRFSDLGFDKIFWCYEEANFKPVN